MTTPVTGTITFLFTDIEGSTQLWEKHPEAMQGALKRHDELMRDAIEAQQGRVFKTMGDAFCAAFANAPDALRAALQAQRALQAETWPPPVGALRVRMGLHTGNAEERDNDYFGPSVNRVARLQAAAHGGQILLSLATQELVRDELPRGITLIHLGQFRLKDLFRPEQIYQVAAADLRRDFPPLRTLEARLHNLPSQSTPFIGRERELTALLNLLRRADVRLVTLTGPGGTGKTRLSLQAAADLVDEFEHGVWFIELAALRDPQLVLPAIAATLKVKEIPNENLTDTLHKHLADKQLLLVLDNFEQVVAASPHIGELLKNAQRLKIIASSREILRVYGEHDYPVPPLGLPAKTRRQTIAVLSQYEAVRLFIERAKAAKPGFDITEENAPAIAEICTRLDGLPLAIELAAARSRMLPPNAMLERLNGRLKLLTGGARNLPARQQTLRGAVDWSYDLLTDDEKKLFARLSVFAGGWTLEAAEAVCAAELTSDVFSGLESLLEKSLIRELIGAGDETRFVMLETIREYALEKLTQSAEHEAIHNAHAVFYVTFAERYDANTMRRAADAALMFAQLAAEQDNLRAAVAWLLQTRQSEGVLRLGTALWLYWQFAGRAREGLAWMKQGLALAQATPPKLKADALRTSANLAMNQMDAALTVAYLEEALGLYRAIQDNKGIAACLNNLGNYQMNVAQAYARALALYEESLALYRQLNDELAGTTPLMNLGELALLMKQPEQARRYLDEVVTIARKLDSMERIGIGLNCAGLVAYHSQHYADAATAWLESLTLAYRTRALAPMVNLTRELSWLAALQQNYAAAVRLLAFSETLNLEVGEGFNPKLDDTERHRQAAQAALGAEAFEAEWAAGAQLSLDEGAQLALAQKWEKT